MSSSQPTFVIRAAAGMTADDPVQYHGDLNAGGFNGDIELLMAHY